MIFIVTDFGLAGPYTGQMKAVLAAEAPGVPVIDLFADIPPFNPKAAAYLLGAYAPFQPAGSTFLWKGGGAASMCKRSTRKP